MNKSQKILTFIIIVFFMYIALAYLLEWDPVCGGSLIYTDDSRSGGLFTDIPAKIILAGDRVIDGFGNGEEDKVPIDGGESKSKMSVGSSMTEYLKSELA